MNKGGGLACAKRNDLDAAYRYAREENMRVFRMLQTSVECITMLEGLSGGIVDYSLWSGISKI